MSPSQAQILFQSALIALLSIVGIVVTFTFGVSLLTIFGLDQRIAGLLIDGIAGLFVLAIGMSSIVFSIQLMAWAIATALHYLGRLARRAWDR